MKLAENEGIVPNRFPPDYNESIFDPNHRDYNNYVPMSFSAPKVVTLPGIFHVLMNVENEFYSSARSSRDART
jgi:hypothetical protein